MNDAPSGANKTVTTLEDAAYTFSASDFGFSDTAFRVFILMASRRLKSDRFFTDDFRPELYTEFGIEYIKRNSMLTVLRRHYPQLAPALEGVGGERSCGGTALGAAVRSSRRAPRSGDARPRPAPPSRPPNGSGWPPPSCNWSRPRRFPRLTNRSPGN